MNILITGGAGFIGSHIFLRLIENNNIFIIDNFSNSSRNIVDKLRKISRKNVSIFDFSLHDKYYLEDTFKKYNFDAVVHLASLKSVEESIRYPAKYYWNNVLGSKILFNTMKKFKTKNLIYSSSATVYGDPLYLPINEYHPIKGFNNYAKNKIEIENLLQNDVFFSTDCSVKILRYFNPIGAHPSYLIGDNPKKASNIMPLIIQVALKQKDYFNIYGNNYNTHDGTCIRDYIHIMDLVDGHYNALMYKKRGISVFNLGTGKGYSVLDLLNEFNVANNINIPFIYSERRSGDVDSVYSDSSKANKFLNFSPKYSLRDMCIDSWRYAIANSKYL